MKKFITFIICLYLILTPSSSVKGLVNDVNDVNDKNDKKINVQNIKNKNIQNLYNEKNKNIIAVSNNSKTYFLSNDDLYLMAQVVYAESRGEPYKGQVAVASVILNRLSSSNFPNTINQVIKQSNAFSCVNNGKINVKPNNLSYKAVVEALKGNDPTNNALYFYNPKISTCPWMKNVSKKNSISIGNHIFFKTN